ncbi:hypothetical protein N0V86_006307 [Didymella sp. IMI 355093]|nr:hypothetical protein N0V86_006307 [Didymella sp. IMI 355093]
MNTKNKPSRTIVYKYVEVLHLAATDSVADPTSKSPNDSLASQTATPDPQNTSPLLTGDLGQATKRLHKGKTIPGHFFVSF